MLNILDFFRFKEAGPILRYLSTHSNESALTIVNAIEGNYVTCKETLDLLVLENVLERKTIGRSHAYSFSNKHLAKKIIIPFLKQEQQYFLDILKDIKNGLDKYSDIILLYGSYARSLKRRYKKNETNTLSDIDVFCVLNKKTRKKDLDEIEAYKESFFENHGVILSVNSIKESGLKKFTKTKLFKEIKKDAFEMNGSIVDIIKKQGM